MLRIVYANLGYSRDIDGSIGHHMRRGHRHVYTSRRVQLRSLGFLRKRLSELRPDLSCFVEIDRGSLTNGFFDQLPSLREDHHTTVRIDNKYGADKRFRRLSVSVGKSNAFLATRPLDYAARYLSAGKKRLVYDIEMSGVRVIVAHLSLRYRIRCIQIAELARWVAERDAPTVVVGDFNLFRGAGELEPLLRDGRLVHANAHSGPTFRFGPYRATLDTCLLSPALRDEADVEIIDQPFSDHQMIKVDIRTAVSDEAGRLAEPVLVAGDAEPEPV